MPTVFDSFKQSSLTWFFQVKFELKVTPKYLTVETSWMFTPSIFRFNDLYGLSLLKWKRTKLVFKILRASLLDFIHSATVLSSWFRISSRSLRFLLEQYILVSSAKKWKLSSFDVFGKSLIYRKTTGVQEWIPEVLHKWLKENQIMAIYTYNTIPFKQISEGVFHIGGYHPPRSA